MGFLLFDILICFALALVVIRMLWNYRRNAKQYPNEYSLEAVESRDEFQAAAIKTAENTAKNLQNMHDRLGKYLRELTSEISLAEARYSSLTSGEKKSDSRAKEAAALVEKLSVLRDKQREAELWQGRATMLKNALAVRTTEVVTQAEVTRREEALQTLADEVHLAMDSLEDQAARTLASLKAI